MIPTFKNEKGTQLPWEWKKLKASSFDWTSDPWNSPGILLESILTSVDRLDELKLVARKGTLQKHPWKTR